MIGDNVVLRPPRFPGSNNLLSRLQVSTTVCRMSASAQTISRAEIGRVRILNICDKYYTMTHTVILSSLSALECAADRLQRPSSRQLLPTSASARQHANAKRRLDQQIYDVDPIEAPTELKRLRAFPIQESLFAPADAARPHGVGLPATRRHAAAAWQLAVPPILAQGRRCQRGIASKGFDGDLQVLKLWSRARRRLELTLQLGEGQSFAKFFSK